MKKILLTILIIIIVLSINVLAVNIDIGSAAIDRNSSAVSYTEVDKNNPANASGKISKVEIFAVSGYDMANVEVGIFYIVSGNNLSTRDSEVIGTVVGGSKQTFAVDLNVVEGDYIGAYWSGGRIELTSGTATGNWRLAGDNIPCTNVTFELYANRTISLYGYSAAGWSHKWNTATISKWNGQVITKWNGLQ